MNREEPDDQVYTHPVLEQVWDVLEASQVDEVVIVEVMSLINELAIQAEAECQRCLDVFAKESLDANRK